MSPLARVAERRALAPGLAALLVVLPACGGPDDDDTTPSASPSAAEPTPTATATATPTAAPTPAASRWQVFSDLTIADEGTGLDLDDDGGPDNALPNAIDTLATTLVEEVGAAIADEGPGGACEADQSCTLTVEQVANAQAAAELVITQAVSVDTFNAALDALFAGDAAPLGLEMAPTSATQGDLTLWAGSSDGEGGWIPDEALSVLAGGVDLGGALTVVGPGTLALRFEIPIPGEDPVPVELVLQELTMEVHWQDAGLSGDLLSGAIAVDDLVAYAETIVQAVFPPCDPIPCEDGADLDALLAEIEERLLAVSDIDCPAGQPCISAAFEYETAAATVAP